MLSLLSLIIISYNVAGAQFAAVTQEFNKRSHCVDIAQEESEFIEQFCFQYDAKIKLSSLMGEPVDYAVMRWYFSNDNLSGLKFRTTEALQGIRPYWDFLPNKEFDDWLHRLSVSTVFHIEIRNENSYPIEYDSGVFYYSDPGVVLGADKAWSFSTPGSSNWDRFLFRSGRSCTSLKKNIDEENYLSESVAKNEVTQSYQLWAPLLCNTRVYGISDLNHVIRKIIADKCEASGNCKKEEPIKKKAKVKDWFARDDEKQSEEQTGLTQQEIIAKSTENGVTDWFAVDKLTKKEEARRKAEEEKQRLQNQREIEKQRQQEKEKAAAIAAQKEEEKRALEVRLGGCLIYTAKNNSSYLVRSKEDDKCAWSEAGGFKIVNAKGQILRVLDQKYINWRVAEDGFYLSEEFYIHYSEASSYCKPETGVSQVDVYSLFDLSFITSKQVRYRAPVNICFSSG